MGLERTGEFRTVAFCEIEKYPQSVLRKHWPDVPIFEDVRTLHAADMPETVDVICGGYPCQPFSLAGKRQGKDDDRHLWPEFLRLIKECRPAYVICENVVGIVSMGLDQVLSDLEGQGYASRTFIIPACAVNAPHRRDRVWIIAYNASKVNREHNSGEVQRQEPQPGKGIGGNVISNTSRELLDRTRDTREARRDEFTDGCCSVANSNGTGEQGYFTGTDFKRITRNEWITRPGVRARNDGISGRVARLKALGNSVVPQIPELIGMAILASIKEYGN